MGFVTIKPPFGEDFVIFSNHLKQIKDKDAWKVRLFAYLLQSLAFLLDISSTFRGQLEILSPLLGVCLVKVVFHFLP